MQKRKRNAHTHIDLGTHLHVNTLHLITSAVIFICAHVIHLITAACRCVRRWKHLIHLITAMCSQVHCCNEMYKVFPSLYVYYTAVIRCITSVPYTSHYSSNDLFQKNPGAAGSFPARLLLLQGFFATEPHIHVHTWEQICTRIPYYSSSNLLQKNNLLLKNPVAVGHVSTHEPPTNIPVYMYTS